jgi:hypothetical protein
VTYFKGMFNVLGSPAQVPEPELLSVLVPLNLRVGVQVLDFGRDSNLHFNEGSIIPARHTKKEKEHS